MAGKIKLGNRPKSFKHTVKFKLLDGSEGQIECLYKYRTRTEFGEFLDHLMAAAKIDKSRDGEISMAELMGKTRDANADYLLDVLEGWDLDEDLNRDALQQLADEVPAASNAIMEAYRMAIQEGRLGN